MNKSSSNIVRVAIRRPLYKLLDYVYDISPSPQPGMRVKISLGTTIITGIIIEVNSQSELENLKPILEVIDDAPVIDKSLLSLLQWASQYYFYPIGEVIFHALPSALRKGNIRKKELIWELNNAGNITDIKKSLSNAPKQLAIYEYLSTSEFEVKQLKAKFGDNWRYTLKQLEIKGLVKSKEVDPKYPTGGLSKQSSDLDGARLQLTKEQENCVSEICHRFEEEQKKPILLHGITGSGKTEVYLNVIQPLLKKQQQVLVLVPEIGLTPQLSQRFQSFFPDTIVSTLHSGLTDNDRQAIWFGAKEGTIQIIIGTRSAVFTPMKNLAAIIVDEEHDVSFKQQEGFLYQGRDMAIKRAYDANIPIVLGSATPSLESFHNAKTNRYHYLTLKNRPGRSLPPKMIIQDVTSLVLEAGISQMMLQEIKQHLDKKNQIMLFLNRRGFSPVLMCPDCGWHAHCNRCDIGMTYHASLSKTICHHCGLEEKVDQGCPSCRGGRLTTLGQGTERIEEVLNTHFPDTLVIRIDRDSTTQKGALENKLKAIRSGQPVIIIGTQMLTKGHDFPNLTLVGILDVDQSLFSMDFRAQERLAQQVLQVSGRAGRSAKKGRVILQTTQPKHPVLLNLLSRGYANTAEQILQERSIWQYPPLGAQALIRVSGINENIALKFIDQVRTILDGLNRDGVDVLGPMPSPLAKRANRYRYQIQLSTSKGRKELHLLLSKALGSLQKIRKTVGVRWVIDIDPMDFL